MSRSVFVPWLVSTPQAYLALEVEEEQRRRHSGGYEERGFWVDMRGPF